MPVMGFLISHQAITAHRCFSLQNTLEDVSNFDEMFTLERTVVTPPVSQRAISSSEQDLFSHFTYTADWC